MNTKFTRIALTTVCFFNLNLEPSAGTLDTTFNPAGTPPGTVQYPTLSGTSLALQADGKVVIAGFTLPFPFNFALVRYTATGALDPSFGTGGLVTTSIGTASLISNIIVQPDGKLVAVGSAVIGGNEIFAIARYNTDGTLDASFGTGGIVTTAIGLSGSDAFDVVLQTDGSIVVAGRTITPFEFAVARYTSAGVLDATFGTGGIVTTAIGIADVATCVTLQADGKIVVGGSSATSANQFAIVRYKTNGSLDTTFGGTGIVTTTIGTDSNIVDITMQATTGKIIAVGSTTAGGGSFAIARYNLDGSLDATFGVNGIVTTAIGSGANGFGVAIQQNGKIVVSGSSQQPATTFTLARYTINGTLDTTFGSGGIVLTPYTGSNPSGAYKVAIQKNGKIVAAGVFDGALGGARYFGDPTTTLACSLRLINKYGPRL